MDLIRIGEVSSINPKKGTARVAFDDEDGMVSYDLPVVQRNSFRNHDYAMPDIGEDVVCVFREGGIEDGFILGAFYAGEVTPPDSTNDVRSVVFSDGTRIEYNRATHTLLAQIAETKIVADRQGIIAEAPTSVSVKGGQTVNVEGGETVNIKTGTQVNIASPVLTLTMGGTTMTLRDGNAEITSSSLTFKGSMNVTGNLSVNGNITSTGSIHGTNI